MTTEEKIKGLEHLLRKCPDVITANIYSHLDAVTKADTGAAMSKELGEKGHKESADLAVSPCYIIFCSSN